MNPHFLALADRVALAKQELEYATEVLERARATCAHEWGKPRYPPIRTEGYETQDLMGHFTQREDGTIDAPRVYVPPTEKPRWTRECAACGLEEVTEKTSEKITRTPEFGGR